MVPVTLNPSTEVHLRYWLYSQWKIIKNSSQGLVESTHFALKWHIATFVPIWTRYNESLSFYVMDRSLIVLYLRIWNGNKQMTNNKNVTAKGFSRMGDIMALLSFPWSCTGYGTDFSFTETFSVESARHVMNRRQPRPSVADTPELLSNCELCCCQNHADHAVHQVFELEQPNLQYMWDQGSIQC